MSASKATTLAVLIDAQNVSHALADDIFRNINALGLTSIRQVYADWSRPDAGGWKTVLQRHALRPMQQHDHVAGKDVADFALIIDAMDLLHSGKHDAFCLVSSDSDFSALAVRIRQSGGKVFGLGESKAPQSFQAACDRFIMLGKVAAEKSETRAKQVVADPIRKQHAGTAIAVAKSPKLSAVVPVPGSVRKVVAPAAMAKPVALPSKAPLSGADLATLRQAITAKADDIGWAYVAEVGSYLGQHTPFETRKHVASLSKLLRVCGIAELRGEGKNLAVRLRSAQ